MPSESTIDIVPLSSEYRQPVINLLMSSFFLQEPLNAALQFEIPHEPMSWVDRIIDDALRDQCSFVAIDRSRPSHDMVGVIINAISQRSQPTDESVTTSEKLNFIFSLIDQVMHGHDLFERLKTDRLFHCDVINIDESQRGQNLSARLITASLDKAQQSGITGAFVVCTSLFSRKAFQKHGFELVNEILYADCGKGRLKDMGVHDRCSLLARQL